MVAHGQGGGADRAGRASRRTPEQRGRRLTYAVFLALSVVFIVWSTADIALGVFAPREERPLETACAHGVRALADGVERGLATRYAAGLASGDVGGASFARALGPEWNEAGPVEARCAANAAGSRAFALVSQFRFAAEQAMRREADLAPFRRDLTAALGDAH